MKLDQMLNLLNYDLMNEWKHFHFYLANASRLTGLHCHEYKEFFTEAAASEMKHILAFQDLIIGLGGVPVTTCKEIETFECPESALRGALSMELEVVANFIQRQKDATLLAENDPINGGWIDVFLDGQIQDSREDVDHLKQILRGCTK